MKADKVRITTDNGSVLELDGPGDITQETSDAIVNAANSTLLGGGGVDGAIHRRGGSTILGECQQYVGRHGRLPPGQAMITGGGQLPAKYVIHTVGPIYRDGQHQEAELLASCYRECLLLAEQKGVSSISFPAISTGAYGYPLHEAAPIAIGAVLDALQKSNTVTRVRFVLFDPAALKAYVQAAERMLKDQPAYKLDRYQSS
jgi:O-acetyl-ADP-ribose deacetylase (regulator of RNase III)